MLRKSVFSLASVAFALVVATPAAAQNESSVRGQAPATCRASADGQGGACGSGLGRDYRERAARSAPAILFFGGSSVRLPPNRPREEAVRSQPPRQPAFILPLRLQ